MINVSYNMSIKLLVQSLIFNLVYTLTPREFREHYAQIINNLKNNYHYKYGDDVKLFGPKVSVNSLLHQNIGNYTFL